MADLDSLHMYHINFVYQNFNKGCRNDFVEGGVGGEEDEEGDGEGDEEKGVGPEETGERLRHVFEHLDVLAEPRNLPHQEHLQIGSI